MVSIGGGGNLPNRHQRKLDNSEALIAAYKKRVGKYPAMPIELSPNNGVPTEERLDTFYRMAEQFGVPITIIDELDSNTLPVGERGYKQLLNTLASIVENGSGFLRNLQKIKLIESYCVSAGMQADGTLVFEYTLSDTRTNSSKKAVLPPPYESILELINPCLEDCKGSLRNPTLLIEHEAVHDLMIRACREFVEKSKFTSSQPDCMVDDIMTFYLRQLHKKAPAIMDEVAKNTMLTGYFTRAPQEFFTTLFEANASRIASQTTIITQEMADTVGSTVDHLTQQKEAHLPKVSPEQRKQLTALINLIKDTPFNLTDWWESHSFLRDEFTRNLKVPEVDEAEAKFLAENAHLLDLPKRFMTMLENLDEKELMITMLHRLV